MRTAFGIGIVAVALLLNGCTSQNSRSSGNLNGGEIRAGNGASGPNSSVHSTDFERMAIQMASSILSIPEIKNASAPPTVIVTPKSNATESPLDRDAFHERLVIQLNKYAGTKIRFLFRNIPKDVEHGKEWKQSGGSAEKLDANASKFKSPDYFLTGRLSIMHQNAIQNDVDHLLYSYQLLEASTGELIWMNTAELEKRNL